MEREPRDLGGHDAQPPLPGEQDHDPPDGERSHEITIEFGQLWLIPPEGGSWGEWVITRGTAEAGHEERAVDHRTAFYIAKFLEHASTPALRKLGATGEVYSVGLQEEIISLHAEQTEQARSWMEWLAHYCQARTDHGLVEHWRADIDRQDRADAEQVRREHILATVDHLFEAVPAMQRVGNAGQPGWHVLVRHTGRPGGWIVSEGEPGTRRVWETDSDTELAGAYVEIVEAQRQWILETWGGTARVNGEEDPREQGQAPDDTRP